MKAKEAQPILKRNQHFFKIMTLYVVDKFNYNLHRQQKLKTKNSGALEPNIAITAT